MGLGLSKHRSPPLPLIVMLLVSPPGPWSWMSTGAFLGAEAWAHSMERDPPFGCGTESTAPAVTKYRASSQSEVHRSGGRWPILWAGGAK